MSGKDPELTKLGEQLTAARAAYAEAKKVTDGAKVKLNDSGSRIQKINDEITSLRQRIDMEYDAMRAQRAEGNRDAADAHRAAAQELQSELSGKYDEKKAYFTSLDAAREGFRQALNVQRESRDRVQQAWNDFNARLDILKEKNRIEQAKWKEKPCRNCGKMIRYNVEWKHIPNLCHDCFEKDKVNWEDRTCTRCGASFRINKTWEHIPTICPSCRREVKAEKAARRAQRAAALAAQEAQAPVHIAAS